MAHPQRVDLGWLMSVSADVLGEQEARNALQDGAGQNPFIEAYRSAVEVADAKLTNNPDREWIKSATYEQLKPKLTVGPSYYSSRVWGMYATKVELRKAANGLVAGPDVTMQIAHLRMFWINRSLSTTAHCSH